MIIIAGDHVSLPAGDLLGTVGDDFLYKHKIIHPDIEGATFYLAVEFSNGVVSSAISPDGTFCVPAMMLREVGEFNAQIWAEKEITASVTRRWFSEKFRVRIGTALPRLT